MMLMMLAPLASIISIIGVPFLLLLEWASMRQVWHALPRPNPIKCACCIVFGCVLPMCPVLLFCGSEACPMRETWLLLAADLQKKSSRALEHGQPAQRTMSKVIIDGFPWIFDPSWSQSSQNGVPIVQLIGWSKPKKSYQSTTSAGPAPAARPKIRPCRRGPGQCPCPEL